MELYLVELTVSNWPASLAWYRDRFGLRVEWISEPSRYALLVGEAGRVAVKEGAPSPGTTKLIFRVNDLAATLQKLARSGLVPEQPPTISAEGYRSARFADPDGHRIEMFEWINFSSP